mmetsp:Transcript_4942/g.18986  ORF Transcript_4942/g.18986 Transcript_4942/m.18986 type:complete len:271 (+) Transcript_4942:1350-2162(+)
MPDNAKTPVSALISVRTRSTIVLSSPCGQDPTMASYLAPLARSRKSKKSSLQTLISPRAPASLACTFLSHRVHSKPKYFTIKSTTVPSCSTTSTRVSGEYVRMNDATAAPPAHPSANTLRTGPSPGDAIATATYVASLHESNANPSGSFGSFSASTAPSLPLHGPRTSALVHSPPDPSSTAISITLSASSPLSSALSTCSMTSTLHVNFPVRASTPNGVTNVNVSINNANVQRSSASNSSCALNVGVVALAIPLDESTKIGCPVLSSSST